MSPLHKTRRRTNAPKKHWGNFNQESRSLSRYLFFSITLVIWTKTDSKVSSLCKECPFPNTKTRWEKWRLLPKTMDGSARFHQKHLQPIHAKKSSTSSRRFLSIRSRPSINGVPCFGVGSEWKKVWSSQQNTFSNNLSRDIGDVIKIWCNKATLFAVPYSSVPQFFAAFAVQEPRTPMLANQGINKIRFAVEILTLVR